MKAIRAVSLPNFDLIAAYSIFIASYLVFALGKFPGLRIDGTLARIRASAVMAQFAGVGDCEPGGTGPATASSTGLVHRCRRLLAKLRAACFQRR